MLDGYDEVGEENQAKIRTALKEGHVPDEDWKGVRLHMLSYVTSKIHD